MSTFLNVKKDQLTFLVDLGYHEIPTCTVYEIARFKGDVSIILYKSGKLLIQGSPQKCAMIDALFLNYCKQVPLAKTLESSYMDAATLLSQGPKGIYAPFIGSDEVLKGDTFGGLIVAAVKTTEKQHDALIQLGVTDSKLLAQPQIEKLAEQIKAHAKWTVIECWPEEYNQAISSTVLLNRLHREAAAKVGNGFHIVDEYPGCKVGNYSTTHGESKFPEIAAASIIARSYAMIHIQTLSQQLGFKVPLGSTHVSDALSQLKQSGKNPQLFVKMHFKNVKVALA